MQHLLNRSFNWAMILSSLIIFSSCFDPEESEFEKQYRIEKSILESHFETNDISASIDDDSGLYYEVLTSNSSGKPVKENDVVSIRYTMHTLEGKLIDSLITSSRPDTSIRFQHSNRALFPQGINMGVRLMNEGEKLRMYLPSYLSFNNFSYKTLLPSGSRLVVDVEVTRVQSPNELLQEEKDSIANYVSAHGLENVSEKSNGIFYQLLQEGSGTLAKNGQVVKLHYKGSYLNGTVFDQTQANKPVEFLLGNVDRPLIKGFEEGLKLITIPLLKQVGFKPDAHA
ncbi:MAG: FKBP-type peptidyl-prolyl cis-trans isomerase, partial [Cyclobacteriaceae bacterium]